MKKVLVVEDTVTIAQAIKLLLKSEGIGFHYISNGNCVVQTVKKEGIDLVITDLNMPKMSGKEVIKALKKDKKTKGIPIILLTADTRALENDSDLRLCDRLITKPFDNKELITETKKLLG